MLTQLEKRALVDNSDILFRPAPAIADAMIRRHMNDYTNYVPKNIMPLNGWFYAALALCIGFWAAVIRWVI